MFAGMYWIDYFRKCVDDLSGLYAKGEGEAIVSILLEHAAGMSRAELIKKDDQGNALADAEFKVIDEKGQTVQEKLVSTKDGVVEVEVYKKILDMAIQMQVRRK